MDPPPTNVAVQAHQTEYVQQYPEKGDTLKAEEKMEVIQLDPEKSEDAQLKQEMFEDIQLQPEKFEDVKEEGPLFHCNISDTQLVHKIAEELLVGLAMACVDNTTGGIFKTPATMADDIRTEMIDYLMQRSESFVAETFILEAGSEVEVSDHPLDIILVFIDDFDSMKRNWVSRVSGWLLSEMREEKVDDFVQEMELNSFWVLDRREHVAQSLLRNVDFKNLYHCSLKFKSEEELSEHQSKCGFRSVLCDNEGCNATFSAAHLEEHDSICPFKLLPCEQKCSQYLLRREMDRHCITICPMKLVSCPFYSIGCHTPVPQCTIKEHFSENLHSHLLCVLRFNHKEASTEYLRLRAEQIEKSPLSSGLEAIRVAKFLSSAVKDVEQKLGQLRIEEKDSEAKKTKEDNLREESPGGSLTEPTQIEHASS
ncbi:TNF receptor-associated factor 6-like protein [Drosera capensis]